MRRLIRGRVLKAYVNTARGGYRYVNLHDEEGQHLCRVSGLVAAAFIGPRPPGHEVCHRNGMAADDRAENLRYGTPKSNAQDRIAHGTQLRGELAPTARLKESDVVRILRNGEPADELGRLYGVHPGHINNIRRRVRWAHV